MISTCRINELGKATGGKPGDNNGQEYRIQPWYSFGQKYVLRYPDQNARSLIAEYAATMARMNIVGYDQPHRTDVWTGLQNSDYDPAKMTIPRQADCSSSTTANVKAVGFKLNIDSLKSITMSTTTSTMVSNYKAAGFTVLSGSKYTSSDKYLLKGDIVVNPGKHVVVNLTDGSCIGSTVPKTKNPVKKVIEKISGGRSYMFNVSTVRNGSSGNSVLLLEEILKSRGMYSGALDGLSGTGVVSGINAYQSARRTQGVELGTNGSNDGSCGPKMWADILGL